VTVPEEFRSKRVLVVEDDPTTRESLARTLAHEGYEIGTASEGEAASDLIRSGTWSVVILDLGLPDGSGLDWCREWRRRGHSVPILILTARADVDSRVAGLDAGADDYLAKPFALAELKARVRALLRRTAEGTSDRVLVRGDLRVDFARRRAVIGDEEIPITRREFDVLERVAGAKGMVVLKEDLLEDFWGEVTPEHSASLDVIITRIRRKLDRGSKDSIIRTLRGSGYAMQMKAED